MSDFARELAAWRLEFSGREDGLEATWELAGIEERWGDSLFSAGEPGASAHYRAAQRALVPPGTIFSSQEESERRMEAYTRLTGRLYDIGPDDRPRNVRPAPPEPGPPEPAPAGPPTVNRQAAPLYDGTDHWRHHELGDLWAEAAQGLAANYPSAALRACRWSMHHFERYQKMWSAHLPASRWDSDGSAEMAEVQDLQDSLSAGEAEPSLPEWVDLLLDCDWEASFAALPVGVPPAEFVPLARLFKEVREER